MTKDGYSNREIKRGISLTFFSQLVKIGLSLVSLPLLARYLEPSDFGYFAIIFALYLVFDLIRDLGISVAQLGMEDASDNQRSEYFWISLYSSVFFFAIALVFYSIIIAALSMTNNFYQFLILNFGLIINGFGSQFLLDLRLKLKFKSIAGIDSLASLLSIIAAVSVAWSHNGIWALVIQQMLLSLITASLAFLLSDFRPIANFKTAIHFRNIKNCLWMSASQVIDLLSKSLVTLQLGKEFSLTEIGMYDRAQQLQNIPNNSLNIPVRNVALPIMRRSMFDTDKLQENLLKTQFVLLNIAFLMYSYLFINADEIIYLIYGSKYAASVPIFEILLIIGMVQSASHIGIWVLLLSKINKSNLHLSLVNLTLVLISVQIGLEFGLLPALFGLLVANLLKTGAIFEVARRNSGFKLNRLFLQSLILLLAYISISLLLASLMAFLSSTLVTGVVFVFSAMFLLLSSSVLLSFCHIFPNEGSNDFIALLSFLRQFIRRFM